MKKYLLLFFLLNLSFYSHAQEEALHPCGSPVGKTEWLQHYQQYSLDYRTGGDTILYVPLTIHLVGSSSGSSYFRERQLLDALCRLNMDFESTDIQFFIEGEVRYLDNSDWYNHQSVLEGAEMMFANNIDNTINTYFVSDPAGNCGYNLPYAGICMAKSCAGENDHTWAHEIGHNLSLPHPFLGWEGGISWDGSINHDFNEPAPEKVYYDYTYFKDTLILDTLIIDTAIVERVNDPNCENAADGFCDTKPDYLAFRWNCNSNNESTIVQTDPDGVQFVSDATLFMSYADDACSSRFSDDQGLAMRANLYDEKPTYLYNQVPTDPVSDEVLLQLTPIDEEVVQFDNVYLEWEPVPGATHYVVELTRIQQIVQFDYIVAGTSLWVDNLQNDRTYYWRVRPFNSHFFCTDMSEDATFITADITSTISVEGVDHWDIFPTKLDKERNITIKMETSSVLRLKFELLDISGKKVFEKALSRTNIGNNRFDFSLPAYLQSGMYFVALYSDDGKMVKKIIMN